MEVKDEVLPPLDLKMFWEDPRAAGRRAKIVSVSPASAYHFEPPRRGTQMKVSLEICDSLSGPASVAGQASGNNPQEKESISSIRERYAAVNKNLSKYRVVKKELSGFSTEGGELVAYFEGASVVKMAATRGGDGPLVRRVLLPGRGIGLRLLPA